MAECGDFSHMLVAHADYTVILHIYLYNLLNLLSVFLMYVIFKY